MSLVTSARRLFGISSGGVPPKLFIHMYVADNEALCFHIPVEFRKDIVATEQGAHKQLEDVGVSVVPS